MSFSGPYRTEEKKGVISADFWGAILFTPHMCICNTCIPNLCLVMFSVITLNSVTCWPGTYLDALGNSGFRLSAT